MRHFYMRAEMGKNAGRKEALVDQDYKDAATLAALAAPFRHARRGRARSAMKACNFGGIAVSRSPYTKCKLADTSDVDAIADIALASEFRHCRLQSSQRCCLFINNEKIMGSLQSKVVALQYAAPLRRVRRPSDRAADRANPAHFRAPRR